MEPNVTLAFTIRGFVLFRAGTTTRLPVVCCAPTRAHKVSVRAARASDFVMGGTSTYLSNADELRHLENETSVPGRRFPRGPTYRDGLSGIQTCRRMFSSRWWAPWSRQSPSKPRHSTCGFADRR